jgi:hypothetical protein
MFFSTLVAAAFVAAPLLYAAINIIISPKIDSSMWDTFSRIPDANVVVVAPRLSEYVFKKFVLFVPFFHILFIYLFISWRKMFTRVHDYRETLPEICDLDVGVIHRTMRNIYNK